MSFSKKKLKTTAPKQTAYSIGLLSIAGVFIFGVVLIQYISNIEFNILSPLQTIVSSENTGTDQDITKKEKINILITGRGGWNHDAPDLTDTMILASIQPASQSISMLSIPRDLYVAYEWGWEWRINEIYANTLNQTQDATLAMQELKDKISQITGQNIEYYMNIDFQSFIEVIDIFDGVEITLDETFVDNTYPDGNGWHVTFRLNQWTWTIDGDIALKYVRSRHSTSDFDRSLRQQEVLWALKNKIVTNGLLKNTRKIKELYQVFNKHVETDIALTDILKLASIANQDYRILSSNLNDSCFYGTQNCEKWWFLYSPQRDLFWWASVLLIDGSYKGNLSDYSGVEKYFDLIFNNNTLFQESYTINVFNGNRESFLASTMADSIKKYGFNIPSTGSIWNTPSLYPKSIIYYNGISEDSNTIQALKSFTQADFISSPAPLYSSQAAQIEIVLWWDYEDVFNF